MEKIFVKERIVKDGKLVAIPGMYLTVEEAKKLGLVKEKEEKKEVVVVKEVKLTKEKRGRK